MVAGIREVVVVSTLEKPTRKQQSELPVRTEHFQIAHEAVRSISGTSLSADALARFVKTHPQINTPGGAPRYLVIGSLAVAALTGDARCWEDCSDISLMHTGSTPGYLSTPLTWSSREDGYFVIRTYDLHEPNVKLNSRAHVRCAQVADADDKILCHVLVPHPAVLTVLTAADVFGARNEARISRDCGALLELLAGVAPEKMPEELRQWRKLIHDTYEGLQEGKRGGAHHEIQRAVSELAMRTESGKFLDLIPNLALHDLVTK